MELRTVNPRKLKFNPNNPRRTKAMPEQDAQLAANILAHGLIQPTLVRQERRRPGNRRRRAPRALLDQGQAR